MPSAGPRPARLVNGPRSTRRPWPDEPAGDGSPGLRRMSGYVIRRVAAMPALLLAVVTVTFLITRLIPASPLTSILGPRALTDPDSVAAAKAHWGLDGPLTGQYWRYLVNMAHGD